MEVDVNPNASGDALGAAARLNVAAWERASELVALLAGEAELGRADGAQIAVGSGAGDAINAGRSSGVPTTGLKVLYDGEQGTAVVLQYFATAEDMDAGAQAFGAMDAAETPGTRASVDMCEIKLEVEAS